MEPSWIEPLISMKDRQAAVVALGRAYLAASDIERQAVIAGWDFGVGWDYPTPTRLACRVNETSSPRDRIIASLVLDSLQTDMSSREAIVALCHTYHSCRLAGLDADAIFFEVAKALPADAARALVSFANRREENKALEKFAGFRVRTADGETEVHIDLDWHGSTSGSS
jgi:hypothetical protein